MRSAFVYNFLIEANILASIAIVLMIVVRKFLRGKIGSRVLWFAWFLVALRLLCPLALPNPAINEIRLYNSSNMGVRPIAGHIRAEFIDTASKIGFSSREGSAVSQIAFQIEHETYNGRLAMPLLWGYFAGAAGVLGYMMYQNIQFRKVLKKNRIEELSGETYEQYLSLCKQKGIKHVPVYMTDPLQSACLVGVFRPFIALPLSTPPVDILRVLDHEVCHVKGRDNLWGLVRNLCCVIHWFNPLVWWAASMSRTDCEIKCDDRVTAGLGQEDRLAYANTLMQASIYKRKPNGTVITTCMSMTGRQMKNRIRQIVNGKKTLRWLSAGFAALASVTLIFAFATAEYTPTFVSDAPKVVEGYAAFSQLKSEGDAIAYAKTFMRHGLLGVGTVTLDFKAVREYDTWTVQAFPPSGLPFTLIFDIYGMISNYTCGVADLNYAQMKPSDQPITDLSPESKQYLQMVTAFANTMLPGVGSAFDVIRIDSDVTNSDGRYLFISTGNGRTRTAHSFYLQIEPEVRLMVFTPTAESYLAFNTTGDRKALSEYNADNVKADFISYLTEVISFTNGQVDAAEISISFLPEDQVWYARCTIAANQVKGELKGILQYNSGARDRYIVGRLYDKMGGPLEYASLYAYQRRNDPVIGKEQAKAKGLIALEDTLHLQGAESNVVDYYTERAEYHVYFKHATEKSWGIVHVDAYSGKAKMIVDYSQKGDDVYIVPGTETVP